MELLVFAHRGEAHAFIENLPNLKAEAQQPSSKYSNGQQTLLICGEGFHNSLTSTAYTLGRNEFSRVLNFGIAGALDQELEKYSIQKVRTVYKAFKKDLEFKSFTSENSAKGIDCLTSSERTFDEELVKTYKNFASLVDRELWGIGFVCDKLKVPFNSYKLISDYALRTEACEEIQKQGKEFSYKLFDFYQNLERNENAPKPLLIEDLFLTESMRRTFNNLKPQLENKYEKPLSEILNFSDFQKEERPKTRALKIIEEMKKLLAPLRFEIREKIEEKIIPFQTEECKIHFDPNLENESIKFNLIVDSELKLKNQFKNLESFPFLEIKNIFSGELEANREDQDKKDV